MARAKHKPDTIFALASGRGRAGVAVVRLSGPDSARALKALTGNKPPPPGKARLSSFSDPKAGEKIDSGLVLWFKAPKSFTGEDVAELHVHGSHAVLSRLYSALSGLPGLRAAEPGEFSYRAFQNGKMDLTESEGLNDLVMADTEAQRKQALAQLGGSLKQLYEGWRARLVSAQAEIEALIDFSDEEIPADLLPGVRREAEKLASEMKDQLADKHRGEAIRSGFKIVLLGPPNVGKSSLLNALSKEERAIVSDVAGTTRDVIEVHMNLAGYPAVLVDTAGLREAGDAIEREGVKRAEAASREAGLRLVLVEASQWPDLPPAATKHLDGKALLVLTKADLHLVKTKKAYPVSAKTGEGLESLLDAIEKRVVTALEAAEPAGITRIRHRRALEQAADALGRFLGHPGDADPALMAEDLRMASRALGRITGHIGVEEVLGEIFARFCIGK